MTEKVFSTMFLPDLPAPRLPAALPPAAVSWIESVVGSHRRIAVKGPLGARATTMHAVDVVDSEGEVLQLAIRRFHDADRLARDKWYQPSHEAQVLQFLGANDIPSPRLIALDASAQHCDVPALLTTRLSGELVIPPSVPEGYVNNLVVALAKIHELIWVSANPLPAYESYFDQRGRQGRCPPRWSVQPDLWERVFEILKSSAPSTSTGFIHRDYHPAQVLFEGTRVTGVCDWLTACRGPHGVDLARMRLNLAEGWSLEMAEEFRAAYSALVGEERVHPYWDLLDAADVLLDLPDRSPAQVLPGHGRFEEWVKQAVAALG